MLPLDADFSAASQVEVLAVENASDATSASEQRNGIRFIVSVSLLKLVGEVVLPVRGNPII